MLFINTSVKKKIATFTSYAFPFRFYVNCLAFLEDMTGSRLWFKVFFVFAFKKSILFVYYIG